MVEGDKVINLVDRRIGSRADAADAAKLQLVNARQQAGMTAEQFAASLTGYLSWKATAELVECWETDIAPPGDVVMAAQAIAEADSSAPDTTVTRPTAAGKLGGIEAAFDSRGEFVASVPIDNLFDTASRIEASGLSLNLVCQQYPNNRLVDRLNDGLNLECLFLRPHGQAIGMREQEEGYSSGELSSLTALNIKTLTGLVRPRLDNEAVGRMVVGTYDEVVRFNMIFIDDTLCVFQPYLHAERGIETPTLIVYKLERGGLYPTLRRSYNWLKERCAYDG